MSAPSPTSSSNASNSPIPSPTPLTPSSAHNVSFALPPQADQFTNFEGLNLDNSSANQQSAPSSGPVRRKPSRRANTAERRATHNAVERQRRETLNGRFLDLAALLPNLASVRRPSKSAIVNSSIALIHTQRRSRATAAKEIRLLKLEADALRAEVNEWRDRAGMGLARVEEPNRSREFEELVSGGLEEAEEGLLEEERRALEIVKEGLRLDASAGLVGNDMYGSNQFTYSMGGSGMYAGLADDEDDDSSDGQLSRHRPGSQGSVNSMGSLPINMNIPRQNVNPVIYDASAGLLQSHPSQNAGINAYTSYDLAGAPTHQSLGLAGLTPAKPQWNTSAVQMFVPQTNYAQQQQVYTPPSASFLGGFGLRDDVSDHSDSPAGSVADLSAFNVHPVMNHRSRSVTSMNSTVHSAGTPPSASAVAVSFADANTAGDAFAAAYGAPFPIAGRVAGGGNTFGAAMSIFM